MEDGNNVTYGRWEAEHHALEDRVSALEKAGADEQTGRRSRRDRLWLAVLSLVTAVVGPLIVTSVIAFLHLRGSG